MSIPKRDPKFTMVDLQKSADAFLAAGQEYWNACRKAGLDVGAVTFIEDSAMGLAIFTRGEYRDLLMRHIPEVGQVYHLGGTIDETEPA